MKTYYLKSQPTQPWQLPTYYKITGVDHNFQVVSIWNCKSLEIEDIDDETIIEYAHWLNTQDITHPVIETTRADFDEQYSKLTNKLNKLAVA